METAQTARSCCMQLTVYMRNAYPKNGKWYNAGMRACSLELWLVREKVRVSVRDRVGVRVSDAVRVSTFLARDVIYMLHAIDGLARSTDRAALAMDLSTAQQSINRAKIDR